MIVERSSQPYITAALSLAISAVFPPWGAPCHAQQPTSSQPADSQTVGPTREFEIRQGIPHLASKPIKLWGLRCNNALLSPAVTERLINNLDNYIEHGINFISISFQGTNGGHPDVNAGPNAFTPDGRLIPAYANRAEAIIREADRRGMVVCLVVAMPRKDELLQDEAAIQSAMQETGRFLESRKLRNVMLNLFQEFHHPTRISHEIFREPNGQQKKALLTAWVKEVAPQIEVGICPNHMNSSEYSYPGSDINFFQEEMSIPPSGFSVNTETSDRDSSGHEGVFNRFHIDEMRKEWESYKARPEIAMLFRSPYVEDVRGQMGTGPNFEMGGYGTGDKDRGIRVYFEWIKQNVGSWQFPEHIRLSDAEQTQTLNKPIGEQGR